MKHWLGAHLLMLALLCVVESSTEQKSSARVSFYAKPSMMSSGLPVKVCMNTAPHMIEGPFFVLKTLCSPLILNVQDHETDDDHDILLYYTSAFVNNVSKLRSTEFAPAQGRASI